MNNNKGYRSITREQAQALWEVGIYEFECCHSGDWENKFSWTSPMLMGNESPCDLGHATKDTWDREVFRVEVQPNEAEDLPPANS
jgi:hypothetical protein